MPEIVFFSDFGSGYWLICLGRYYCWMSIVFAMIAVVSTDAAAVRGQPAAGGRQVELQGDGGGAAGWRSGELSAVQ